MTPTKLTQTDEALVEKIVVEFSDKTILLLDIDEESPILSRLCDEMREFIRPILTREVVKAKADAEMLAEENTRLRKYVDPEWFYLAGDMSSDRCRFSVHEVIDEDWLWDNRAEGSAVVQIETATRCPDIWALVHFFTNEEKDARQSDDEYEIVEFATEEEAQAALAAYREKN